MQYLLRPKRELAKKLDALAEQFGRSSGNQVAVEILEQYHLFYQEAEQAKQDVLVRQRELLGQARGLRGTQKAKADVKRKPDERQGSKK